jgi:hypothetical protein
MKFSADKQEKYCVFKLQEEKLNSVVAPSLKSEMIVLNAEGVKNIIFDMSHIPPPSLSSSAPSTHRPREGRSGTLTDSGRGSMNDLKVVSPPLRSSPPEDSDPSLPSPVSFSNPSGGLPRVCDPRGASAFTV